MFLEEFHSLPEFIPTLKETGFYSAGFGGVVDYLIVPLAFILLAIAPNRSRKLIARLVEWGLKHTTRPPYGAVLQMKAQGAGHSLTMTIFHLDSYILTAAPVVACLLQYLDGSLRKPGLWWQATLVEPVRFFEDLTRLGVQIKQEID
jgi:saccharopine dehydrogenase (NAD+, L-lysine-forming)